MHTTYARIANDTDARKDECQQKSTFVAGIVNTRLTMMTNFCHDFPKMLIPAFLLVASCPFVIVFNSILVDGA